MLLLMIGGFKFKQLCARATVVMVKAVKAYLWCQQGVDFILQPLLLTCRQQASRHKLSRPLRAWKAEGKLSGISCKDTHSIMRAPH